MSFWIFKCNPEKYRLENRLADPNASLTWRVSRYRDQIAPGDTVFLWQTGQRRGIRAILRVDSAPADIPEMAAERQYCVGLDLRLCCRVRATITHREINLPHTLIRATAGLGNLSVFRTREFIPRGTNFPVTSEEGQTLIKLIEHQGA